MSETLAGVTILAWANGAPDVIVSISAGGIEGGVSLAIGSLFGAGLVTTTIVYGYCLYICGTLKVEPQEVGRDIVFFIIATSTIIIYAVIGEITLLMSIIFFGLYIM